MIAPFLPPANGVGDTPPLPYYLYCLVGIAVLVTGVIYWAAWRVVPRWFGYEFVPRKETLEDGTVVTLVRAFLSLGCGTGADARWFVLVLAQENRVMRGEVVALRRTYTHADALESNDGMICLYIRT